MKALLGVVNKINIAVVFLEAKIVKKKYHCIANLRHPSLRNMSVILLPHPSNNSIFQKYFNADHLPLHNNKFFMV